MKREWLLSAGRSLCYVIVAALAMRWWKPLNPAERTVLNSPARPFTVPPTPRPQYQSPYVGEAEPIDRRTSRQKWLDEKLADAVQNNDVLWTQRWARRGGNVNATSQYSTAPLWFAIEFGDLKMVRTLLSLGADVKAPLDSESKGGGALDKALRGGHGTPPDAAIVRAIVEAGVDLSDKQAPLSGAMGLFFEQDHYYASRSKSSKRARDEEALDVLRLMVRRGARVNARHADGTTPLHAAATLGGGDALLVIRFLLKNGAKVDIADRDGYTPFMEAIARREGYDSSPGLYGHYDLRAARLLLQHGAQVDARDKKGRTALMRAAASWSYGNPYAEQLAALRWLLDRGAQIDGRDKDGKSALLHALDRYYLSPDTDIPRALAPIRLMLERGADVGVRDKRGRGVFELARGEWNVTHLLKSHLKRAASLKQAAGAKP